MTPIAFWIKGSNVKVKYGGFDLLQQGVFVPLGHPYSPSHIAQIKDFLDFHHEYCEKKSETFTEF